jgi:tetraprenyl-beta-curcumene synthase
VEQAVEGASNLARPGPPDNRALAKAYLSSSSRYAMTILPAARRELAEWRLRADAIPDPALRRFALAALAKRGNMEGAALLAVFAPQARRAEAVRALVAFQAAYNYLDMLAEQPCADPEANGRDLHEALLVALDPTAAHGDYYASHPHRDDGGYLLRMVETCRTTLAGLPSYAAVASSALAAAARIVQFQSLNLGERQGGHAGLERWARELAPAAGELEWWEAAGAAGSSLGVHVLIGLSADGQLDPRDVRAIDRAYFPWIGALHSLLDSLIDVAEDRLTGQRSLLSHYASPALAASRLRKLARRARFEATALPSPARHQVILTAMSAFYLSAPAAAGQDVRPIAASVASGLGSPPIALSLLRAGRAASGLVRAARASR